MPPPPVATSPRVGSMSSNCSQPQTATSSAFSDAMRCEALLFSGPNCWSCKSPDPDLAHVVSQKDRQVCVLVSLAQFLQRLISLKASFWQQAGLLPFAHKSVANCVPLCAQCHKAFDRPDDPSYVFLPSDLEFFITWELEDRHRRWQEIMPEHRIVPSAEEYRNHQLSRYLISEKDNGGLYCGYFLKQIFFFFDGRCPVNLLEEFAGPKTWHGHPLAAIRRGIAVLGSARCHVLDKSTINDLTTLRELYFDDPSIVDQTLSGLYRTPRLSHKRKREDHDGTENRNPSQKKRATCISEEREQYPSNAAHPRPRGNDSGGQMQQRSHLYSEYVFGPETTSEDKIRHFSPLFMPTDV